MRHSEGMGARVDSRTVAVTAAAMALAGGLGAVAGSMAGVPAGALAALAGLVAAPVLDVALRRRARNAAKAQQLAEFLRVFAPPQPIEPTAEGGSEGLVGQQVARYLRPENQVVSFRPRPELSELLAWSTGTGHIRVRLVTGGGGAGKTRLALRLGEELTACGWLPLWVPGGREGEAVSAVRGLGEPCLLVVDYAETRERLAEMLAALTDSQDVPDVRLLLLARSAGEWWQQLANSSNEQVAGLLEAATPVKLGPVTAADEVEELFSEAVTAFAERLEVNRPRTEWAWSGPAPVLLVVHAAALLAVLDSSLGGTDELPRSTEQVLGGLLQHEARYWWQAARTRGLILDPSVLRFAVALGCLIGADSEANAARLMARIPDLADSTQLRGQVARWLHDLYPETPPASHQAAEWIGLLRPDPVAEHLVVAELARHSDLAPKLLADLDENRVVRALTVLARVIPAQPAIDLVRKALASDVDHLAAPAMSVAAETNPALGDLLADALITQPVSKVTLTQIAEEAPYPSFALARPAAVALWRLTNDPTDSTDAYQRSKWLVNLSNRLGDLGQRKQSLAAIEEAVTIRRTLTEAQPDALLADLASALDSRSIRLAYLGRYEEALAAVEEAVGIHRGLAEAQPDEFQRRLAGSLNNQSNHLANLGRRTEALAAIEEAVGIERGLAKTRPDAFLPSLAGTMHSYSSRLAEVGRRKEALTAIEEAVGIYRSFAGAHPDAFVPKLADSLISQSVHLMDVRRPEDALITAEEATDICRILAQAQPTAFLSALAVSLSNQSACLGELDQWEQALAAIGEAIAIRRGLAEARPEAFLPGLAHSLNNQASCLAKVGSEAEALAAIEEAVGIYRGLAEARPDAFLPDLGMSLFNQSAHLADMGWWQEALAATEEAVGIYRGLAETQPGAFLPGLAIALGNQAGPLAHLGRRDEAVAAVEDAVAVRRALAESQPSVFRSPLAEELYKLAPILAAIGRDKDATAIRAEAQAIRRSLPKAEGNI